MFVIYNIYCSVDMQETIGKTLTMIRRDESSALGPLIKSLASNLSKEEQVCQRERSLFFQCRVFC